LSAVAQISKAYARGFDAERKVLLGEDARLHLLKSDKTIIDTLASGFGPPHANRVAPGAYIEIAGLADGLAEVAYLLITNSDDGVWNNQLLAVQDDSTRPAADEQFYRAFVLPTGKRHFPPDPEPEP